MAVEMIARTDIQTMSVTRHIVPVVKSAKINKFSTTSLSRLGTPAHEANQAAVWQFCCRS